MSSRRARRSSDDTARALIGGAFFVLSVYYVIQTIVKVVKD